MPEPVTKLPLRFLMQSLSTEPAILIRRQGQWEFMSPERPALLNLKGKSHGRTDGGLGTINLPAARRGETVSAVP